MKYYQHFVLRRKEFVNGKEVKPSDIHHSCRLEQTTTTTTKTPVVCPVLARLTFYTNCALVPTRADIFRLLSNSTSVRERHNISGKIRGKFNILTLQSNLQDLEGLCLKCHENISVIWLRCLLNGKEIVRLPLNAQCKAEAYETWNCC